MRSRAHRAAAIAVLLAVTTGMFTIGRTDVTAAAGSYDTPHVHAVASQAACPDGQFRGEYWTSSAPSGTPTYVDPDCAPVDYSWMERPAPGIDQGDGWSARWTQNHPFDAATYRFTLTADDRVRLVVNSVTIYDRWTTQVNPTTHTFDVVMTSGQRNVRLVYGDVAGDARVALSWAKLGASTPTATPTLTNTPAPKPTNTPTATPTPGSEPPVAGQTCPAWLHAQQTTTGPDGQTYPTWHPPTDPASGCHYRHDHGNDPGLFETGFRPPFHYADRTEDGVITENHWGTKVYVLQDAGFNGYRWMFVHHFGTTTLDRVCQRFHETGVYVRRLSDGARVAELHFMADHGPAKALQADGNGAFLSPPGCPTQGQDAVADGSNGVRQIPHGATQGDVTAYEPWGMDNTRIKNVIGMDFAIGVNTPSLIDACANVPTCSLVTRRSDDGSMRFLTYVGYGIRNAPSGTFYTDALGRTILTAGAPGAVKQFVVAGANIALKTRTDDEECYYVGKPVGGGFDDSLAWQMPMSCGPDSVQPSGAHVGHGHAIGSGPN